MSTWRTPFVPRLLAGLLVAALAWALMPGHAQAHGETAHREGVATLVQALAVGSQEAAVILPCGTQVTCSPVVVVQSTSVMLVGPCQPARGRLCHDRRTHIHHHGQEPPPPRLFS